MLALWTLAEIPIFVALPSRGGLAGLLVISARALASLAVGYVIGWLLFTLLCTVQLVDEDRAGTELAMCLQLLATIAANPKQRVSTVRTPSSKL